MGSFYVRGTQFLLIILTIVIICISPLESAPSGSSPNMSPAQMILSSMNSRYNPCEDFYEYACNNWGKYNPIPDGFPMWNNLQAISAGLAPKLQSILEQADSPSDNEAMRKAKRVYRICQSAENVEEGRAEAFKVLIDKVGGWPLIMNDDEWERQRLSWQDVHGKLFKTLVSPALFQCGVLADPKNASNNVLAIDHMPIYLRSEDFLEAENAPVIEGYKDFIQQVADALQGSSNVNKARMRDDIQEIINFEKSLAEISGKELKSEDIDKWYHLTSFSRFQNRFNDAAIAAGPSPLTNINWLATCRDMFSMNPEVRIYGSESLLVKAPDYFTKFAQLLRRTSERTIVNYIIWRVIAQLAPFNPGPIRDAAIEFTNSKRIGVDPLSPIDCISESQMGRAVSYAFVKEYFSPDGKQKAKEMLDDLLQAMQDHIRETAWMDQETKYLAIDKIASINRFTGYPDDFSAATVDNYYKDFIPSDTYFGNELMKMRCDEKRNMKYLGKPVDKKKWPLEPTAVNAAYDAETNSILVPAGILQPPYYDPNRPSLINYAMIGTILGHEVSHALDENGRLYDKTGSLVQWWKQESIDRYNAQTRCFVKQFDNYTLFDDGVTVVKLDGTKTLGENMSDTTGLKLAWRAYQKLRQRRRNREFRIPGLEQFTDDQVFFLAYGNVWCLNSSDEYMKTRASLDEHSPGKPRIDGSVRNFNGFDRVFNCPHTHP